MPRTSSRCGCLHAWLDQAYERFKKEGRMRNLRDLQDAVEEGAVKRIRPKMMAVLAILMGLLPIMWSDGTGADVMKRIATPVVGGVITSFVLDLLIYPVVYMVWKAREVRSAANRDGEPRPTGNGAHPGVR
jgi:Cu(I)/Ag(I) efflux system membrane protein CusA/SilA